MFLLIHIQLQMQLLATSQVQTNRPTSSSKRGGNKDTSRLSTFSLATHATLTRYVPQCIVNDYQVLNIILMEILKGTPQHSIQKNITRSQRQRQEMDFAIASE